MSWEEVRLVETRWDELEKIVKRWQELTRAAKARWGELGRIGESWQEFRGEKSWNELRRIEKSWELEVLTVEIRVHQWNQLKRAASEGELKDLRKCAASPQPPLGKIVQHSLLELPRRAKGQNFASQVECKMCKLCAAHILHQQFAKDNW